MEFVEKKHRSSKGVQLLLLKDVHGLGRSGDLVTSKPGHARNFLVPQGHAVVADKYTLRMQAQLKEERAKQAAVDRTISEELAGRINGLTLEVSVKVDPEGHMYGSVSAADIIEVLKREGLEVERRTVQLAHPIKKTGQHEIHLSLKEGVEAAFTLKVLPEGVEELPEELKATEEDEAVSEEPSE